MIPWKSNTGSSTKQLLQFHPLTQGTRSNCFGPNSPNIRVPNQTFYKLRRSYSPVCPKLGKFCLIWAEDSIQIKFINMWQREKKKACFWPQTLAFLFVANHNSCHCHRKYLDITYDILVLSCNGQCKNLGTQLVWFFTIHFTVHPE